MMETQPIYHKANNTTHFVFYNFLCRRKRTASHAILCYLLYLRKEKNKLNKNVNKQWGNEWFERAWHGFFLSRVAILTIMSYSWSFSLLYQFVCIHNFYAIVMKSKRWIFVCLGQHQTIQYIFLVIKWNLKSVATVCSAEFTKFDLQHVINDNSSRICTKKI